MLPCMLATVVVAVVAVPPVGGASSLRPIPSCEYRLPCWLTEEPGG